MRKGLSVARWRPDPMELFGGALAAVAGVAAVVAGPIELSVVALLIYVMFAKMRTALVVFLLLSIYRLPSPHASVAGFNMDVNKAAVVLLLLTCIAHYGRLIRTARPAEWLLGLAATQAAADLLSIGGSIAPRKAAGEALFALATAVTVVVVGRWLAAEAREERYAWLGRALVVSAVIAAGQAFGLQSVGSKATSLYAPTATGIVVRIAGVAGGFLPGMLLVAITILVVARGRVSRSRVMEAGVLALLISTVYLTYTRGAYIDLVVVLLLVVWRTTKVRSGWLGLGAIVVGITLLVLSIGGIHPAAVGRFEQLRSSSNTLNERFLLWRSAVFLWAHHPLTGVGAGSYNLGLSRFYADRLPAAYYSIYTYPEQQLLGLLSETGALGLLSYLAAMGVLVVRGFRSTGTRWVREMSTRQVFVVAAAVVTLGRLVSEVLGTWFSGNQWLLLAVAILLGEVSSAEPDAWPRSTTLSPLGAPQ